MERKTCVATSQKGQAQCLCGRGFQNHSQLRLHIHDSRFSEETHGYISKEQETTARKYDVRKARNLYVNLSKRGRL